MSEFSNHLTFGTPLLPTDPAQALRQGRFLRVPVISGGNRDEMRSFVGGAALVQPITDERYPQLLKASFGRDADAVQARYPRARYRSAAEAWAAVTTDRSWSCPTSTADQLLARHTTVFGYEFADEHAPNVSGIDVPGLPQGAAHATDLPYLFDLGGRPAPFPADQRHLADDMVAYWTAFAHQGTPDTTAAPHWPAVSSGTGPIQHLAPGEIHPSTTYDDEHNCGFWAGLDTR